MRICMVTDNYFPYPGGIPEHIYHLSKELRKRGHHVLVLTANVSGLSRSTLSTESDDQHFIFRVGRSIIIPANRSYARVTVGWRLGAQLKELFRRARFDIIHIHGSLAPTLPLSALKESHVTNVVTFHADHESSIGYRSFRWFLNPYFRRIHGLIAVSPAARDSMAKYFPGNYRIIPNGVDTDFFSPDVPCLPQFRDRRPKILFMGRFDPRKGLTYLLKALPAVKREIPDFLCIIVGTGPLGYAHYSRTLDKEIADNVHFAGLIPSEDRPYYYASCDVFCAPSTGNESFGIVLLEAMASGKPVVASDIAGYRDVVENGVDGVLTPPQDEDGIAEKLITLLKDPARARTMGAAGRIKALAYSWQRIADQVEAYYEELVSRRSGE